ncbi:MAG: PQQ-dependent sugar dehydrogenase [Opitutales bacterium]|nr:PQQ-dependent sugar dehydrogenase [Opitutales bacterium]
MLRFRFPAAPAFLSLLLAAVSAVHADAPIADPLPDPPEAPWGITLEQWKRIPVSSANQQQPRLNLFRQTADGRFFVNDQRGYLYVIETEEAAPRRYLDVSVHFPQFDWITQDAGQTGFSSFAFHPEFTDNGIFYTVVSAPATTGTATFAGKRPIPGPGGSSRQPSHHDVLLGWQADDPGATTFTGNVREVLRIEQPYADHNVGEIAFNPMSRPGDTDYGMLYIATGDGGWVFKQVSPDPQRAAQDLTSPLGKILRIDPEGGAGADGAYAVPPENPFVGTADALPEIWAYGLRNPHRINWDRVTGGLFAYDIGGDFIEEINLIERGGNYGWSEREGTFRHDEELIFPLQEDDSGFLYPVVQYAHADRNGAISGGFVYRGDAIPELFGYYIYADFTNRDELFVSPASPLDKLADTETLPVYTLPVFNSHGHRTTLAGIIRGQSGQRTDLRVGRDRNEELYFLNKHNGWIYRVKPGPVRPETRLSTTDIRTGPKGHGFTIAVTLEDPDAFRSVEWTDSAITLEGPAFGQGSSTLHFRYAEPLSTGERLLWINGQEVTVRVKDTPVAKKQSWYFDPDNGWIWIDAEFFPYAWFAEYGSWFPVGR